MARFKAVDGLAAVEYAQQFTAEHVVQKVVAQEHGAQQAPQMRDRFVKWISSGGGSVARGHMNGAGVSTVHGGDQVHGLIPLRADALEIDGGEADGAQALGNLARTGDGP